MNSVVRDNDTEINRLAQYNRSSLMLEISGISFNENENMSYMILKVVMLTKMTWFDINQVDVTHNISKKENGLIIILFDKKSDRYNFYKQQQQQKIHNLRAHQYQSTQLVDEEVTLPGINKKQYGETTDNEGLIFLIESLKPTNRRLLKEVKKAS